MLEIQHGAADPLVADEHIASLPDDDERDIFFPQQRHDDRNVGRARRFKVVIRRASDPERRVPAHRLTELDAPAEVFSYFVEIDHDAFFVFNCFRNSSPYLQMSPAPIVITISFACVIFANASGTFLLSAT